MDSNTQVSNKQSDSELLASFKSTGASEKSASSPTFFDKVKTSIVNIGKVALSVVTLPLTLAGLGMAKLTRSEKWVQRFGDVVQFRSTIWNTRLITPLMQNVQTLPSSSQTNHRQANTVTPPGRQDVHNETPPAERKESVLDAPADDRRIETDKASKGDSQAARDALYGALTTAQSVLMGGMSKEIRGYKDLQSLVNAADVVMKNLAKRDTGKDGENALGTDEVNKIREQTKALQASTSEFVVHSKVAQWKSIFDGAQTHNIDIPDELGQQYGALVALTDVRPGEFDADGARKIIEALKTDGADLRQRVEYIQELHNRVTTNTERIKELMALRGQLNRNEPFDEGVHGTAAYILKEDKDDMRNTISLEDLAKTVAELTEVMDQIQREIHALKKEVAAAQTTNA
jgi:hypothetical protein